MHYSRTYLLFGSIVFLLIFYMLFPQKINNVALLALKMCVFIDYLCSLFNEHCKEWLKNLRFVLLIIWYDQQNRRQEEIVTFLYTSLNLILICVINFKLMKSVDKNLGPLAVCGRTPRPWFHNHSCSVFMLLVHQSFTFHLDQAQTRDHMTC